MKNRRDSHVLLLSAFLSFVLALTNSLSASANDKGKAWNEDSRAYSEGWPWPPLPNWWNGAEPSNKQQSITNLRLGFWLPCRSDWSTNDCIDSVNVYDKSNNLLGALTFVPNPLFDPFEIRQGWYQSREGGDGPLIDNSAFWLDGPTDQGPMEGHWLLPTGVSTASGNRKVFAVVQRMLGGVQALVQSQTTSGTPEPLPEGITFEVVLKSKELAKRARWIYSNGKDPEVFFRAGGLVVMRGVTAKLPWPPAGSNVCKAGNDVKAARDEVFMGVNIFLFSPSSNSNTPGDVIIGTNGWWCFNGFYWDAESRSLVAKVGAAHFYSDNSVVDGWLEVKVKASRVREWWGVSPEEATGFARVEIVYDNGLTKVATVSAKYIKQYDWIDIRAYGFTYSNPQIRISFEKPGIKSGTVTSSPTKGITGSKSSISKKTTITCTKGKTTRKVTAVKPKCPIGFTIKK